MTPQPQGIFEQSENGDGNKFLTKCGALIVLMKTFDNTNTITTDKAKIPGWKRTLDIGLIFISLPLLVPLVIAVAVIIRLVSKGPILFKQERIGYGGQKFLFFKFRTMYIGADSVSHEGHLCQLIHSGTPMMKMDSQGDSRIIPFGIFLRATGLDELPQLINVLRGEMSIVGPRPCLPYEFKLYRPWQRERFNAAPGLTGLWQVSGKNNRTFSEMIELDIEYSRHFNFLLDLEIIFKTIPVLLGQLLETRKKNSVPQKIVAKPKTIFSVRATNH